MWGFLGVLAFSFSLPFTQVSRRGVRTVLWGQVRPGNGRQRYILQQFRGGKWRTVGGARRTTARGYLTRTVSLPLVKR